MLQILQRLFARPTMPEATPPEPLAAQWMVVGLGNPGPKYAATRHNVGYMALAELVDDAALRPYPGVPAEVSVEEGILYVRSTTFMNHSGRPVAKLAEATGIAPENIIVIHDELDVAPGRVKLRLGGNENGHNGLKSISEALGTRDYLRVRIGIGRPPAGTSVSDFVLSPVEDVDQGVLNAAEAVRLIISDGLAKAQNDIHPRS